MGWFGMGWGGLEWDVVVVVWPAVGFGMGIVWMAMGLLSGIVILCITKWKSSHILQFSEELFFIYLLPPIIFNAGFQVKKKQFFHNFLTIMMFGVIGVFISSSIITAGSWWLFPTLGFVGLTVRDYLGEFFFHFI
ncbi:hypothetical protein Patl1_04050 [Pistacia atlantica]|uniref:Uncharacterized protein n=1 Tax=Pistacia atlantica TaxID=434234 RepID=A0ACC1BWF5_9ROSI|nr:hypothetical protein Patl1_04050 [Pistacia atlantica]